MGKFVILQKLGRENLNVFVLTSMITMTLQNLCPMVIHYLNVQYGNNLLFLFVILHQG